MLHIPYDNWGTVIGQGASEVAYICPGIFQYVQISYDIGRGNKSDT